MNRDAWLRPSLESNVREGCRVQNTCHVNHCPLNSSCIDLWDHYECMCDMGKTKLLLFSFKKIYLKVGSDIR